MSNQTVNWDDCIEVVSITDVGMRRSNNQDSHVVLIAEDEETWNSRGHLLVVADGMGAHAAGELASKLAAQGVPHHYYKHQELSAPEAILLAVREANGEIHRRGQANSEFHNMGTTCSSLLLLPQGALIAHVGDSRVYRLRNHLLEQLTFDHSLVWEMRAAGGQFRDQSVAAGIPKNVITRSLGPNADVQVDLEGPFRILPNDLFLICSDGLTARIDENEFGPILELLPPEEAAALLVDLSNVRGGPDNCTLIIATVNNRFEEPSREKVPPLVVGAHLKPKKVIHPAVWGTLIASTLIAGGFIVLGHYVPSAIFAGIAICAAAYAGYIKLDGQGQGGVALTGNKRLGKAPYVQTSSTANAEFVNRLVESVRYQIEYDEPSASEEDMIRVDGCLDEALAHANQNAFADAVRLCGVAIKVLLKK